jgi:hypothetical protein
VTTPLALVLDTAFAIVAVSQLPRRRRRVERSPEPIAAVVRDGRFGENMLIAQSRVGIRLVNEQRPALHISMANSDSARIALKDVSALRLWLHGHASADLRPPSAMPVLDPQIAAWELEISTAGEWLRCYGSTLDLPTWHTLLRLRQLVQVPGARAATPVVEGPRALPNPGLSTSI